MINLQVENLDEALAQLKQEGVDVDPKVESYDYGKFGRIMDPEGNRVELWEPPPS
jgi:predicted enzyme related to lactoylglutathione lyase